MGSAASFALDTQRRLEPAGLRLRLQCTRRHACRPLPGRPARSEVAKESDERCGASTLACRAGTHSRRLWPAAAHKGVETSLDAAGTSSTI